MVVILAGARGAFFARRCITLPCNMGTPNASWLPEYMEATASVSFLWVQPAIEALIEEGGDVRVLCRRRGIVDFIQ